jgi:hypothetical protein
MRRRLPYLIPILTILLSIPAYFYAVQANRALHFAIGRLDGAFLADRESFYPAARMEGPERAGDGSVAVHEFTGRLTKADAEFRLPYHALRSPVRIDVRCHRFGLEGTVSLEVNGEHVEDFPFGARSYPWGGIRAVIPQDVAEKGPLEITLRTRGGATPPSHLPGDLGLGVDWIELTPLSEGAVLQPTRGQWTGLVLLLALAPVFVRFLRGSALASILAAPLVALATILSTLLYPVLSAQALGLAWLIVPGTALLLRAAELFDRGGTAAETERAR